MNIFQCESWIVLVFNVNKLIKDSVNVNIKSDRQSIIVHFTSDDDNYIKSILNHINLKRNHINSRALISRESRFVVSEKLE